MDQILEQAAERLKKNTFMHYCGIELEAVEPDHAVLRMTHRPELENPYGIFHGGALFTLADSTAGTAVHTDGRQYVTQNSDFHFLGNVRQGEVRAEARVRHRGKKTCLVMVDVTDEAGKLLCTGAFTFFCIQG